MSTDRCIFIYIFIYLSVYLYGYPYVYLSIDWSIYLSISTSTHTLLTHPHLQLRERAPQHYIYLYLYLFIYLSIYLSVCLAIYIYIYTSIYIYLRWERVRACVPDRGRVCRSLAFTRYSFTYSRAHESVVLSFLWPACIAHTAAILWHDYWAIYDPPSTSLLYVTHLAILVITISCKGQVEASLERRKERAHDVF